MKYSDDVQATIEREAREREMTLEQVTSSLENYNSKMSGFIPIEKVAPYQVELAVSYTDANEPSQIANAAGMLLVRAAATYWARAAGVHVPDALRYFDSMEKWDAQEFAKKYPITLPTNDEGLIDGLALANSDISGTLQRAIMLDLQADIAVTSTQGGDDTWFDYLPNGIHQLQSIQDESWAYIWADIWNTHPYGITTPDEEMTDEQEEANDELEEAIAEKYGFYIQDVTSGFIYYFMRPHTD